MKGFTKFLILIMTLFCLNVKAQSDTSIVWINLEGSLYLAIPATNVDEIVKATESLKFYHRWYMDAQYKENVKDSIISIYKDITGVYEIDVQKLKEIAENKKAIDAQVLQDLREDNKQLKKKKNRNFFKGLGVGASSTAILLLILMVL